MSDAVAKRKKVTRRTFPREENPRVKIILRSDRNVEHLLDVQVAADVSGRQLVVFMAEIGVVIPLKRGVRRRAEPAGPLVGTNLDRVVGGVERTANLVVAENLVKGKITVAFVRVCKGLVGKIVTGVGSHGRKGTVKRKAGGVSETAGI